MQSDFSSNSERECDFHQVKFVRSRHVAMVAMLSMAVCGVVFATTNKDHKMVPSDAATRSIKEIVSLDKVQTDHNSGPCVAAYGPLLEVEHVIDARAMRLKENMPKWELDTGIALRDKQYKPELLEKIEKVLDNATWSDYIGAEAVITTGDMQAITRCMLGDPKVDLFAKHAPRQLSDKNALRQLHGADNQAGDPWPNGQVKYYYHSSCRDACKQAFHAAISEIQQQVPCVRFSYSNSGNYILVRTDKGGCWSPLGIVGSGAQELNLGNGCWTTGIAVHEALHALGMHHEQTRSDRDKYVTIQWQNIKPDTVFNFQKDPDTHTGSSYDFLSIMHYGATDFSTNGQQTIAPKIAEAARYMGQRMHASQYDVEQLCKFYGCTSTCKPKVDNKDVIEKLVGGGGGGGGRQRRAPDTKKGCTCHPDWKREGFDKCTNPRNKGCCNPDQDEKGAWCFTTTQCSGLTYDYCMPPKTAPKTHEGCRCMKGWTYNGKKSSASTGHCFNPNNHAGGTWCFIVKNSCGRGSYETWDYCEPK